MKMLLQKLTDIELLTIDKIDAEQQKLEAVKAIQNMLHQIDFTSEVVQSDNLEKLTCLIKHIKGTDLTIIETEIVKILAD